MVDLVLYDGQCKFCRANVKALSRLDRAGSLRYQPETGLHEMAVVTASGQRYGGIDAVRYLSRRLPLLWWLAAVLHIPGSRTFWQWLYRKVAERRYCFGRATCSLN